jgi:hypothetical protein
MTIQILAAALLASTSLLAFADDSLPAKAMKDSPGVQGEGTTADPTAKPKDGSLTDKAMKDTPGVTGAGTTANPTAKPTDGSLADKAMKDAPATAPAKTE